MNSEELAQEIHAHLLRVKRVVTEEEIKRVYETLEGAGALEIHLAQCRKTLREILLEFPEFFVDEGTGLWRGEITNKFDSVMNVASVRGGMSSRDRGSLRVREQPTRRRISPGFDRFNATSSGPSRTDSPKPIRTPPSRTEVPEVSRFRFIKPKRVHPFQKGSTTILDFQNRLPRQDSRSDQVMKDFEVKILHFANLNKFSIRFKDDDLEYLRKSFEIGRESKKVYHSLQNPLDKQWRENEPCTVWKDGWFRGITLDSNQNFIFVYLVDEGVKVMVERKDILPMPGKIINYGCFAMKATMNLSEEEIEEIELRSSSMLQTERKLRRNQFEKVFIRFVDSRIKKSVIEPCQVQIFIYFNGRKVNILDFLNFL